MNDLLKKLNTLVNAKLSDLTPSLPRFERTPDLDRQVAELRQRINEALEHEDHLQTAAQNLRTEVARLDALTDTALAQGRDSEARYLLEQMKRTEQRLAMAESDLHLHQRSAEDLIQRVNQLEAAAGDFKHARQSQSEASPQPSTTPKKSDAPRASRGPVGPVGANDVDEDDTIPRNPAESYAKPVRDAGQEQVERTETAVERISGIIKDAQVRTRERINALGELLEAREKQTPDQTPLMRPDIIKKKAKQVRQEADEVPPERREDMEAARAALENIMPRPPKTDEDDDLAQRLRRLSKPE